MSEGRGSLYDAMPASSSSPSMPWAGFNSVDLQTAEFAGFHGGRLNWLSAAWLSRLDPGIQHAQANPHMMLAATPSLPPHLRKVERLVDAQQGWPLAPALHTPGA